MHTDMKKPAGGSNPAAGDTDYGIVASLYRRIKTFALSAAGLLLVIFWGLR